MHDSIFSDVLLLLFSSLLNQIVLKTNSPGFPSGNSERMADMLRVDFLLEVEKYRNKNLPD